MDDAALHEVMCDLREARRARKAGPPPRLRGVTDLADAYRIQKLTYESTSVPRHYKVGVTSPGLQAALGVDHPAYGPLPDPPEVDGARLERDAFIAPLLEVEVAFVLGRAPGDPHSSAAVRAAVDEVRVAIEVADCRTLDWDIELVDLVADSGCAGAAVLGEAPLPPSALPASFAAVLEHDGTEIARGGDALVAGGAWAMLSWLAAEIAAAGLPLGAGSVVLTGACTPPTAPPGPGRFVGRIDGLGDVGFTLS